MNIETDKLLENAMRDAIKEGVKKQMVDGYNSPLTKLINDALSANTGAFRTLLEEAISSCVNEPAFRAEIATAVRHSLAKTLVARFGGDMEKQVNVLKSDPTTRARITLAIEEIVKQGSK